ncbi:MAG: ribonuclease P protein component [Buchnera aphidicola (Schlechtendalia peitan)]
MTNVFKKRVRLLNSAHFKYVFNKFNKIYCKELIILERTNKLTFSRLGICISKKKIRHACKRNHIKRIIRESFRLIQNQLINSDFIVVINAQSLNISQKLLAEKIGKLWIYYYQ